MGIEFEDLRSIIEGVKNLPPHMRQKMLILGDAHIHMSWQQIESLAIEQNFSLVMDYNKQELSPVTLGKALGFFQVDTLDVNGKATITHDLHENLPRSMIENYDMLVDAGVLFWCFDPGQVLKNIFRMVKKNGIFVHITALSGFYGRGFYNPHPLLFERFYLYNQARFVLSSFRGPPQNIPRWYKVLKRFFGIRLEVDIHRSAGNVFLKSGSRRQIQFEAELAVPESPILPNNSRANLVFQKVESVEPERPGNLI